VKALYESFGSFSDHSIARERVETKLKGYGYPIIVWIDRLNCDADEAGNFVNSTGINYVGDFISNGRWHAYGFPPWENAIAIQFKLKFGGA
jgi:hypothetical protein